jgi:hypothetical protein
MLAHHPNFSEYVEIHDIQIKEMQDMCIGYPKSNIVARTY